MMRTMILTLSLALAPLALAADAPAPKASKTLASTLKVFAFPQKGQTASEQSQAEAECYNWAVENTGTDPFQLLKDAAKNADQKSKQVEDAKASAGQGTVAKEVLKGAVVGTLIGSFSGNEGKGAGYGAAAGLLRGSRVKKQQREEAAREAEQHSEEVSAELEDQMDDFRKAFSVCLEAKGYMVKY